MKAFNYDMFERLELPQIILSTKYHKHLGTINNIDKESINATFNLNSAQEISFDVYKKMDNKECELWDSIVDLKYIFVPDYQEYYCISAPFDEDNKTIKHIVGTSACEYELSHRKLYNFECNTEADILREDYVPTIFYNKDNPNASLLHRVLKDKCPDYKIGYVDESIAIKQRTFSANDQDIYSFLTNDVATELECVFIFDSVNRTISVYAIETYGENTGIYISPENYAESITIDGDVDNVFNCLKIEGGDELMTATIANVNPNGSNYIYHFLEDMLNDMPDELVQKIVAYNELSTTLQPTYEEYTKKIYELIDQELYLTSEMMPEVTTPETSASEESTTLVNELKNVEVQNINSLSKTSADLAVKGMAQVIVDPRYDINIDSSTLSSVSNNKRTWKGIITITNKGNEEDTATTSQFSVTIKSNDYEAYLYQKIQKSLDRDDSVFYTIFEIEDMTEFETELTKYSLNRLKSFESSYQTCLDVLIEQGVTTDTTELYGVDLYETMYKPYYNRIMAIQAEMVIRENEITVVQKENAKYEKLRYDIQKQLDFKKFIGDDLWIIFSHYRLESTYKNDNYISEGLSNSEVINMASELFEIGKEEAIKASELQYSLTASLNNLLNTKEFKPFKDKIDIGNWINLEADEKIYKLRLINLGINYGSLDKITVSFADVFRVKQLGVVEDTKAILEQAKSMANSYDYVAHQASQGSDANANVKDWLEDGLNSALVNIKNNNNEEVIYDEHGILCRSYDPITDSYSPEVLKITHNVLVYSDNGFLTCKTALGKHNYTYYNETTGQFETTIGYGLSSEFVSSGYIYGSQIVGGDIYSSNYSYTDKVGMHIGLNDCVIEVGGDALTYNITNGLSIKGKITATSGKIGLFTLEDALYSGTTSLTSTTPGVYIGTDGIRQYYNTNQYANLINGVLDCVGAKVNGDITCTNISATKGNIAGWSLSSKAFYNGTNSLTSTTAGTYIGTDGIRQYASADSYTTIIGGKISTNNANIKGKISADTFDINGSTISIENGQETWTIGEYDEFWQYTQISSITGSAKFFAFQSDYDVALNNLRVSNDIHLLNDAHIEGNVHINNKLEADRLRAYSLDTHTITAQKISIKGGQAIYSGDNTVTALQGKSSYLEVAALNSAYAIPWTESDIKLKKNISNSEINALDKIKQINFYQFDWKNKGYHEELGIIANELKDIISNSTIDVALPEGSEYDSLLNVNTYTMLIYALKGIKELIAENEKLYEMINKL